MSVANSVTTYLKETRMTQISLKQIRKSWINLNGNKIKIICTNFQGMYNQAVKRIQHRVKNLDHHQFDSGNSYHSIASDKSLQVEYTKSEGLIYQVLGSILALWRLCFCLSVPKLVGITKHKQMNLHQKLHWCLVHDSGNCIHLMNKNSL